MRVVVPCAVIAGAVWVYLSTRPSRVSAIASSAVESEEIMKRIAAVEREPDLIPTVRSVHIEERSGDMVRYRVTAGVAYLGAWARFVKRIKPSEGIAEWGSLEGSLGFQQTGRIRSETVDGRTITKVVAVTRVTFPVIGPIVTHLSGPVLARIFSKWLRNLGRSWNHRGPF